MRKLRWYIVGLLSVYMLSLGWGYVRLPWGALQTIHGFHEVYPAQPVALQKTTGVSSIQDSYLRRQLNGSVTTNPPKVVPSERHNFSAQVNVKWNALALARVETTFYTSVGVQIQDNQYLCLFGAWIPVHKYALLYGCGGRRPAAPPSVTPVQAREPSAAP